LSGKDVRTEQSFARDESHLPYRDPTNLRARIGWQQRWSIMSRAERFLVLLALGNFLAFLLGVFWLGGDAAQGRTDGQHYWLGYHGKLREVSAGVYRYSALHLLSIFFTHGAALIAIARANERVRDMDERAH